MLCGESSGVECRQQDAFAFCRAWRGERPFEVIFADPPYWKHLGDKDHVGHLLTSNLIAPRLAPDGWFVAEISANQPSPPSNDLTLADRREYGSSAILFYVPCV